MALPATIVSEGFKLTPYGVEWAIEGGDDSFDVEFQRTSDDGTGSPATSGWQDIATLRAGTPTFRDVVGQNTTDRHWYRARQVLTGFDPGPYTTDFCAQVARLSETADPLPLYFDEARRRMDTFYQDDKVLKIDVGVPSSGSIVVTDSTGGSATLTKTVIIPYGEFIPFDENTTWNVGSGWLDPGSTQGQMQFGSSLVLAQGVTITQFRAHLYRDSSDDSASASLQRVTSDASITGLVTLTHGTSGWDTIASSSMAEAVDDLPYNVQANLTSTGIAAGIGARLKWIELDYQMPSYDKAL